MFDEDYGLLYLLLYILVCFVGMYVGGWMAEPTKLPNGCILYDDVIYCEEVNK